MCFFPEKLYTWSKKVPFLGKNGFFGIKTTRFRVRKTYFRVKMACFRIKIFSYQNWGGVFDMKPPLDIWGGVHPPNPPWDSAPGGLVSSSGSVWDALLGKVRTYTLSTYYPFITSMIQTDTIFVRTIKGQLVVSLILKGPIWIFELALLQRSHGSTCRAKLQNQINFSNKCTHLYIIHFRYCVKTFSVNPRFLLKMSVLDFMRVFFTRR